MAAARPGAGRGCRLTAGRDVRSVAGAGRAGRWAVGVCDSKNPTGPALVLNPTDWDHFTTAIQHKRFPPLA
ncbi:DUF397 domain-containing protein [Nocardia cyriacigeorgica]|uniref:DUF397 domain-containing protein n=1 Tax=Nocardia cyriacigeorgica TaxID=135487 RepID=UPI001892EA7D|nr:DUF397 domain-containing protein [Nocardia cyriacigeorgica]MBF6436880.1 DUF397 domain-containing protein [Nocardia cyriacigeorgica]